MGYLSLMQWNAIIIWSNIILYIKHWLRQNMRMKILNIRNTHGISPTGELWAVFGEDLGENLSHHNSTALYFGNKSLQYNDIYIVEFMLLCLLDFELTKRYPIARPYGRAMGYLL